MRGILCDVFLGIKKKLITLKLLFNNLIKIATGLSDVYSGGIRNKQISRTDY